MFQNTYSPTPSQVSRNQAITEALTLLRSLGSSRRDQRHLVRESVHLEGKLTHLGVSASAPQRTHCHVTERAARTPDSADCPAHCRHPLRPHQLPRPPCRHASAMLPSTPPPCRHAISMLPTTPPPCRHAISTVPTTPPPCRQASVMLPTTSPPCRQTFPATCPSPRLWKIHE